MSSKDKRIGNQFWKLRSKHGRNRLFSSPKELWEAACDYFEWCDDNPLFEPRAFNTKDFGIVVEPVAKMRAYTLTGLCLYLGCNSDYFNQFEKGLSGKKDAQSKDFSEVITRIRETIYTQKFEAAAAELLNANIIARDLGLVNKIESKADVTSNGESLNIDALTHEERVTILELSRKLAEKSEK